MRNKLAAVLLALATGSAIAEGPQPLAVVVHGSIDAGVLRAQIGRELGIVVAAADTCPTTCLEISVSVGKASVAYKQSNGSSRTRVVDLGRDHTQWPLVITLLAGNVVRDEAADVLAQLPAPRPPAPDAVDVQDAEPGGPADGTDPAPELAGPGDPVFVIPPPPAPPITRDVLLEQREHMTLGIGLVPGLSTDGLHVGRVRHVIGFHAIAGVSGGSSLLSFSGIADIQQGDASGVQLGGITAVARRVDGIQFAGIATVSRELTGVQVGGIAAVSDSAHGLQLGGIAAVANGRGDIQAAGIATVAGSATLQLAGIATVSRGRTNVQAAGIAAVSGSSSVLQLAGISAVARGTASIQAAGIATSAGTGDVQLAGIANQAGSANIQIAGIVNVAGDVHGVQVAPINIARRVEGVQVGVINVGGDADGFSFGLINIVPGGRSDLEGAMDSGRVGTLLFRHGGNRWHNVYGVGGHPVEENGGSTNDVWMYGLGFGPSWKLATSRIDLEVMGWQVNHGARHSTDVSVLGQLRLTYAFGIGRFAIVAGGVVNGYVSDDRMSPLLTERRAPGSMMEDKVMLTVWPSAFVGVRL